MDNLTFFLLLAALAAGTVVALYGIQQSNRRVELQNRRAERHVGELANLIGVIERMAEWDGRTHRQTIDKLLAALTEPINAPTPPPTPVHEQELAGQAAAAIREFHDGFTGDPVDTPDWTDSMFPDARRDEPRIATVRPGDSVIPGQGNWDQMMNEGRAVVDDQMESGDDQWAGESYE